MMEFCDLKFVLKPCFMCGKGLWLQNCVGVCSELLAEHEADAGVRMAVGFISASVSGIRLAEPSSRFISSRNSALSAPIFDVAYIDIVAQVRAQMPELQHYIAIGDGGPDWAERYETVISDACADQPPIQARPDDIAYLIYTSGTTGWLKGAMLDHKGQIGFIRLLAMGKTDAKSTDRILIVMPFYHIGAKCSQLAYSLPGGTVILHRSYDIRRVAELLERERDCGALGADHGARSARPD